MRRATSLKEGGFAFSQSLLMLKFIVQKADKSKSGKSTEKQACEHEMNAKLDKNTNNNQKKRK